MLAPMQILRNAIARGGRRVIVLPILYMCFVFYLSSIPGDKLPTWGIHFIDLGNFLHFPVYFGLGMLWLLTLTAWPVNSPRIGFHAVFLATLFGALDEVHQNFVPLRCMDIWDVVVNCAGATCAALTWQWIRPMFFPARPIDPKDS
jgi:VanZ family protein